MYFEENHLGILEQEEMFSNKFKKISKYIIIKICYQELTCHDSLVERIFHFLC